MSRLRVRPLRSLRNRLALLFFAASGAWAARTLWQLRHPETALSDPAGRDAHEDLPESLPDEALANAAVGSGAPEPSVFSDPPLPR